ncbi:PREDICTED: zinc finger BED domain-containing [Prunus dulcis]|uniref:PREDICTED: zinc finger BED domain-containing n=1 Tax=Prunus dulcis TaxID=3755 RepID=A0A5E4FFX8_PRUDU|nr:hypothetical protein L3X38_034123 [Prunus dulcis]VVA27044.1 PREDICTED: zinc finger BED domain-containing [Prunus dulcis]
MAFTTYFSDDGCNLHKRILNFCQISNHKDEAIGRLIEKYLVNWGIEKVFSIIVDNASANDGAVKWNSTYLMLNAALKLQKGFDRVALEDSNFEAYFNEVDKDEMPKQKKKRFGGEASSRTRVRTPTAGDWHYARAFVTFLKRFYEATLKFSASKIVTINAPFHEMTKIVNELNGMMQSRDPFMKRVATSMKKKYDKY